MSTVRFFRHSTQLFRHYVPTEFVLLGIVEFLALILSLYLALEVRFLGNSWESKLGSFPLKSIAYASVMQICLIAMGIYQRQSCRFVNVLILRIATGLLLGFVVLGMGYYFAPAYYLGRGVLLLSGLFSFILIILIRTLFQRVFDEHSMWPRVLVLGSGQKSNLIRNARETGELDGINILGYVVMPGEKKDKSEGSLIHLDGQLVKYVEERGIDEIVLAMDDRRTGLPTKELLECKLSGVEILDLLTFFERRTGKIRLDILYPSWFFLSDGFRDSMLRRGSKRALDLAVVLILLPVALPLAFIGGLAVFFEGQGKCSILYSQTRIKEGGTPFKIYKFRSMVADAEKDGVARWASRNDSRITRVGSLLRKIRLDELPQLFNVLKGDMSFVGPRPERPEFVTKLVESIEYYEERHRVKPGLTGWAQICYPYGDTEKDGLEKLQYDLYYVKNYSIFLDLLIILQTIEVVVLGKGAQ